MDTTAFLDHVRGQPWYRGQIVHAQAVSERAARHGTLDRPLPARLERRLQEMGLFPLYAHQALAIDAVRAGRNVIVATSTASGKSLCYHAPVLEAALEDGHSRALYVFPTKALAQDQLRKLKELGACLPRGLRCATYDGDTPPTSRGEVRRSAQVVLTNPDMLHLGVLPNHAAWGDFLKNLRHVVFDESHVYRGVFGSHVANVIRRLRRLCAIHGASPSFILCSATIANPGEHAERLLGMPCHVVDEDGSPYGGKDFLLWNPPFLDEAKMARRSPHAETTAAFSELVRHGVRTIAFSRSRRLAELVYIYVRDRLKADAPEMAPRVRPYRAGYLAEDRRAIERGLFDGELVGVSATNALELGIDIGDLDATIVNGYPGTRASLWQQAGRSGRSGERSLSILVASDNPLDQYFMRHPDALFGRPHEHALIAPANPHILRPHLLCAAYEAPLTRRDEAAFGEEMWPLVREFERQGLLRESRGRWYPSTGVTYPAEGVSIRSTDGAVYQIVEQGSGALLEQIDAAGVFAQAHPGAVYLHQGEAYLVTDLDIPGRTAWARRHAELYYTVARDNTDIRILELVSQKAVNGTRVYLGRVDVSRTVVGFRRKRQFTEEVLDDQPLDLPTQSFLTVALWFDVPEAALQDVGRLKLDLPGGLHACEHAAIGMLPMFAMCDRADIGGVSTPLHPDTGQPQVFIYDGHPGGIGIAERGYDLIVDLWDATLRTIQECPCRGGCPSCVQSPKCGNNNSPLDKRAARVILERLLGEL